MPETYSVEAVLRAVGGDEFVKTFERAQNSVKGLEKTAGTLRSIGNKMQSVGSNLTNKITKPALAAAGALATVTAVKGFGRLMGIDTARAKLKALGHDAGTVENIMDNALEAVTGTSYGMDEAATAAASAVAAGIEPGKELTKYLSLAGDAAAIAGTDFNEMGSIFNKVQTSNKAYNDSLSQLADRGIPIYQWLAKEAQVSEEAVFDMASQGEISSEMFRKAIEDNIGGAAQVIGEESLGAALKNVWADISRIGASFLDSGEDGKGFFTQLKPLVTEFREYLGSLETTAADLGAKFGESFANMIEKLRELKSWWDGLSPTIQGVIKKVTLFGTIGAVAIGPVITIIGKVASVIGTVMAVVGKLKIAFMIASKVIVAALGSLTWPIVAIIAAIAAVAAAVYFYWEPISEFFVELWQTISEIAIQAWEALWEFLQPIIQAIHDFIVEMFTKVMDFWNENGEAIMEASENVWNFIMTIIGFVIDIIVKKVQMMAETIMMIWNFLWPIVQAVVENVWNTIKIIVETAIDVVLGIIKLFSSLFTGDWQGVWDAAKGIAKSIWAGIVNLIRSQITGALNIITSILSSILNTFKDIWNKVKTAVSDGMNKVKGSIKDGMSKALTAVTDKVKDFFNAGKNIVTSIADGIKNAAGKVTDAISGVAGKIRDFLPFSPAKEGALKDIMNVKISESIAESIDKGRSVAVRAMSGLAGALHDEYPSDYSIAGRVGSINGGARSIVESGSNNTIKQPAIINVHVGSKRIASEIVDDITGMQNAKKYGNYKARRVT